MTDRQCEVKNKMWGLRGGRELTTTRVAKQVSAGGSWMYDWTGEVLATVSSYHGALAFLSLRGTMVPKQSGRCMRLPRPFSWARNDKLEPNGIATPRVVGARNEKNAWCWMKEAATKSWRRDLQELVSSLFLGMADNMTISTHGAFSTGRVPVGRGQ